MGNRNCVCCVDGDSDRLSDVAAAAKPKIIDVQDEYPRPTAEEISVHVADDKDQYLRQRDDASKVIAPSHLEEFPHSSTPVTTKFVQDEPEATPAQPETFAVELNMSPGRKLGMGVGYREGDFYPLRITRVLPEGLVASWNEAHPEKQVEIGHHIVELNGKSSSEMAPDQVQKMVANSTCLHILILRNFIGPPDP
mmetsp:Transcript_55816/g.103290  ORF Transcript_55816/g.103290 Transcript_55816/m.103290 type:complete len:195 (-) Transcript_55816:193-777(-)